MNMKPLHFANKKRGEFQPNHLQIFAFSHCLFRLKVYRRNLTMFPFDEKCQEDKVHSQFFKELGHILDAFTTRCNLFNLHY
jgi:hypothetical protein